MAQLKDLIVTGATRLIGNTYAGTIQITTLNAPTAAGGTTYGPGTNGYVLKSNGSSVYWGSDTDTNTTYTFANGSTGNFTVTPSGGSAQTVSIGKPATAGTADQISALTTTDKASSTATQRRVWFSYDNNSTGRPAYDDTFTYQTSTGTLTAKILAPLTSIKVPTESAAYTNGIRFINGTTEKASIGTDLNGILGLYSTDKIVLRPEMNAATKGLEITATSVHPATTITLGTSSNKWSTVYATTFDGNATTASSAAKLTTARTIDGVSFDGSANIIHYGTCSTAAATAAKTVAITGFTLATGTIAYVNFTNQNTKASPTLNINSTGAKAIYYHGARVNYQGLTNGITYQLVYDGTNYVIVNDILPRMGTCGTAAGTAAKAVTCPGFVLYTGAKAEIIFTNQNSHVTPTLNINSTGAKALEITGATTQNKYRFGGTTQVYTVIYDGTKYQVLSPNFRHYFKRGVAAVAATYYTQDDYDAYVTEHGTAPEWNVGDEKTAAVTQVDGAERITLGNEISATANNGMQGFLRIYGSGTNYTEIIPQTNGDRTFYLPNYAGNMYAAHLGNNNALGSASKPVYVAANGRISEGSTYAGGTAVTLNGTSAAASTASFYAPTSAGTSGYFLKSNGTNTAPSWESIVGTDILVKQTAKSDNVNYKILASSNSSPTSGTAYEAIYDTAITINPSTDTITATNFAGNAATATKLATARSINGTNFDGSADITTTNWGTARTITIGNTGKSVNGSANVSWTKAEILGSGNTGQFLRGDHSWSNELVSTGTTDAGGNILRLRTTATIASGYQYGVNHLVPNLTGSSNSNTVILTGVANSPGDQGYLGFHYVGDANNENWVSLGIYGKDHLIKAFYTGYIATSGTTQFSNTTSWNGGTAIIGADGKDKAIIGYCNSSTNGVVFGAHASSCTAWAPVNLSGTQINFRNSETLVGKFLDGCLRLYGNMHQQCLEVTRGTAYNGDLYRTSPEWTDSAGTRLAQIEYHKSATASELFMYVLGDIPEASGQAYSGLQIHKALNSTGNASCWLDANAGTITGAVWNDYAEYRKSNITEPGRCIKELGDGSLTLTNKRLERGCEIISDTFGFAIGKNEECQTPTACAGRVLAYFYEDIEIAKSHIGWPVCSGPEGTVSLMTEEEELHYPSRIIGTISEVPSYEIWHAGGQGNEETSTPIKVNGRIWIRIR